MTATSVTSRGLGDEPNTEPDDDVEGLPQRTGFKLAPKICTDWELNSHVPESPDSESMELAEKLKTTLHCITVLSLKNATLGRAPNGF